MTQQIFVVWFQDHEYNSDDVVPKKEEMIYITQLIYIVPGQEKIFDQFEDIAIPSILRYNGQLLFRIRPEASSFVELNMERPYEIHFVEFKSEQDFEDFKHDEERKKFLYLKEQSIKAAILFQGTKL
jgi:hypothetical protein